MKKLIFFQISDYHDTYFAIKQGKPETYASQRQMIDFSASFIKKYGIGEVCVVSFIGPKESDQIMPNGVRAVNIPFSLKNREHAQIKINKFIDLYAPTHSVVQVPLPKLIKHCVQSKIKTYVMIADSFTGTGLRGMIWCKMFARLLNNPDIELVSNHNYPASCLLKSFGVKAEKIIPWDFTWDIDADEYPVKTLAKNHKAWKFFYAGRILTEKGVGDIIQAMSLLKKKNIEVKAEFAGAGNILEFEQQAAGLGISDRISFLGMVGHDQVLSGMRDADIVLVPSQIKSSEGMPLTIYESFLVKTPLILSDHPMFRTVIKNGVFFKASNPDSLAKAMLALIDNPVLYNQLSENGAAAFKNLLVPWSYIDIIQHWLLGSAADKQWLLAHSLQQLNKIN